MPASNQERIIITVDGKVYDINLRTLSALDAKDFRAAVGVSLSQAFMQQSVDIDVVAGLVWLVERKRRKDLTYAKIAKTFNYATPVEMNDPDDEDAPDVPAEDDGPEA